MNFTLSRSNMSATSVYEIPLWNPSNLNYVKQIMYGKTLYSACLVRLILNNNNHLKHNIQPNSSPFNHEGSSPHNTFDNICGCL